MTEQKIIEEIKKSTCFSENCSKNCIYAENKCAYRKIISALEEIQQYRKIGTVEECRKAVEKQKAKEPDYEGDGYTDGHTVYGTWICPSCGEKYEVDYDDYKHCPEFGQRLDIGG